MSSELVTQAPRARGFLAVRPHAWPFVIWTSMVAWTSILVAALLSDFAGFRHARYDLGNMVQAVWSTAHGRPLEITDASGEQIVRLGSHVDPILALLAPLWLLFPSPLLLGIVQIGACALGALPVYWLGRRHLGSEAAATLAAVAYLAYPWLAWTALDAMHPVTLAIPLFLYAIWFLETGRLWAFAACAALVLMTGELMGLSIAALGLWHWHAHGRPRAGLAIAGFGVAWTTVCLALVVPAFRGGRSPFYSRFDSVGGSPEGVLRTALTDPGAVFSALTTGSDLAYLLWLAAPLAGLFLLSPALSLVAVPQLAINGLSDWPTTTDPRHHYIATIVPFLVAATVRGIGRFETRARKRAIASVVVLCVAFSFFLGPWPGSPGTRPVGFHATLPRTHVEALTDAVALVPDDAAVSTTNLAGSRLSERRYVYSVPVVRDAEWIVLDTWNTWMPGTPTREEGLHPEELRAFRDRILGSVSWRLVFERDGVLVFERAR